MASRTHLPACTLGFTFSALFASVVMAQGLGEDCKHPETYTLAPTELAAALDEHQKWLAEPSTGTPADLCNLAMPGADFSGLDLRRVSFKYSKLKGAKFDHANLTSANFHRSDLEGASFNGAMMEGTVVRKSVLNNAVFDSAQMRGSILRKSSAHGASFRGARLRDADLSKVELHAADLRDADLRSANLRKADLTGADARAVQLDRANVIKANLSRVNFADASMVRVDLTEATFSHTNLHGVELDGLEGISVEQRRGIVEVPGEEFAAASDVTVFESSSSADASWSGATTTSTASQAADAPAVEVVTATQSASASTPAATTSATTAGSGSGRYRAQLGSFKQQSVAESAAQNLSTRYANVFSEFDWFVERVDLGGDQGVWYRLQTGPMKSRSAADVLCQRYKSARSDAGCFPVAAP